MAEAYDKTAPVVHETIDKLGRIIQITKPSTLAQYRFVEMLGSSADSNTYMSMAMPIKYVVGIDDDTKIQCSTKKEYEALIQRLGDEGVEAVMECVRVNYQPADIEDEKKDIKKLAPTP